MSHPITVTESTFATEVENAPGLTVVDFWATWCHPCRAIAPILDQIAAERADSVRVAKVDTDANVQLSTRYNVRSIPTLLFFKDGKVVDRIVGAAPRARIEQVIATHAGAGAHAHQM